MKTIAYVSWKGGTGKTLLATNTAERAINNGLKAVLCDFDPQATALRHCALRKAQNPLATPIPAVRGSITTEGHQALANLIESGRHDLLVCDLPGADSYVMDLLMENMNHVLIPTSGEPYQLMVTASLVAQGREHGWPMTLVPNNLPHFRSRIRKLTGALDALDVPISPARIIHRVDYWDAIEQGLGVCEYAPNSKAAAEINDYWQWLHELISREEDQETQGARRHA